MRAYLEALRRHFAAMGEVSRPRFAAANEALRTWQAEHPAPVAPWRAT